MTKDEVIKTSLWQVTIYAAFQRATIYSQLATEQHKRGVKVTLNREILNKVSNYTSSVDEQTHIANISSIARSIDQEWSEILVGGSISIGVVRKAFNLYLKLMWCLGEIPEPPHCPLDKIIIDKLPYKHRRSWTKISDIDSYKFLISELKKITSGKSLAIWEMETYQKP